MSIMSGSLFMDSPIPPKLDLAGARSHLFQIPQTPTASSSLYRSISFGRKRARNDSQKRRVSESHVDLTSPAPLVNTDYRLAGGGIDQQNYQEPQDSLAELDYRPNRYRDSFLPPIDGSIDSLASSEIDENRSRKRSRRESLFEATASNPDEKGSSQPESFSWSRTVINVVGRVWGFCWSGAFGGFYAGGGRGYKMPDGPSPQVDQNPWYPSSTEKQEYFPVERDPKRNSTPVPGQYPRDDDVDIQQNWVVISNDSQDVFENDASPSAQTKRVRKNIGPSHTRRKSAVMPRLGKKANVAPYHPATPTKAQASPPSKGRESPSSAETERYFAQRRRMEREEDASLRRLNRQLQAMIKEGKQALGTKIEVDEDYDMEY